MRAARVIVTMVVILLAAVFIYTGFSKLIGPAATRWGDRFARWGYIRSAAPAVGVTEVLAGFAVLIPRWRRVATATLIGLMIGALGTHLLNGEVLRVIPPLLLGGLALYVHFSQRERR